MADEAIEKVAVGLKASKKDQLKKWAHQIRARGKEARELARQERVIPSTLASAVGGMASEAVRRNVVGRFAKEARGQGLGLVLAGVGVKMLARWARVPYLGKVGDAHVSQGAQVATLQTFYGDEDLMLIAVERTSAKHKKEAGG